MRSYEFHTLTTHHDLATAVLSGLPEVSETASCVSCGERVGPRGGIFVPCALVLDDESSWLVCNLCIYPIISIS